MIASAVAGFAAQRYGWRYAFWVPAAGLAIVWVLFYMFQRNRPEDVGLPPIEEYRGEPADVVAPGDTVAAEPEGSWAVIAAVLATPMVWLLSLEYFLLKPSRYLFLFWGPLYVNERLGTGAAESGILGSLFELGGPLGMILAGFLSDRVFRSRRMPMTAIGLLGAGVMVLLFPALPVTRWSIGAGLFGIGFFVYVADSLISATAAIDFGTRRGASTAAGLINACGSVGGIVGGTLPGWIERTSRRAAIFGVGFSTPWARPCCLEHCCWSRSGTGCPAPLERRVNPVTLPKQARAIVVGGGIAGCSVGYHLANFGWRDVVLLEQGSLAGGTTWHAAGMVGRLRTSSAMARINDASAKLYAGLEAETGHPTGWKQVGSLLVAG